jgi:hypothetical protein
MRREVYSISFDFPELRSKRPRWNIEQNQELRREMGMTVGASTHAPPAHFLNLAQGRYPGSQVLIRRLPMLAHSGISTNPHLFTVAGAAQALKLILPYLFPV